MSLAPEDVKQLLDLEADDAGSEGTEVEGEDDGACCVL